MIRSKNPELNPIRTSNLLSMSWRYIGLITPQLYLLLIFSCWWAQEAWQKNIETLELVRASESQQRQFHLNKLPLTQAELGPIVERLKRLSPRVAVDLTERSGAAHLHIRISKVEDLDAFREALLVVQSSEEGAIWTATELCFGKCETGPARALVKAHRQRVEVK